MTTYRDDDGHKHQCPLCADGLDFPPANERGPGYYSTEDTVRLRNIRAAFVDGAEVKGVIVAVTGPYGYVIALRMPAHFCRHDEYARNVWQTCRYRLSGDVSVFFNDDTVDDGEGRHRIIPAESEGV